MSGIEHFVEIVVSHENFSVKSHVAILVDGELLHFTRNFHFSLDVPLLQEAVNSHVDDDRILILLRLDGA